MNLIYTEYQDYKYIFIWQMTLVENKNRAILCLTSRITCLLSTHVILKRKSYAMTPD